jgi:hypothetical protein
MEEPPSAREQCRRVTEERWEECAASTGALVMTTMPLLLPLLPLLPAMPLEICTQTIGG